MPRALITFLLALAPALAFAQSSTGAACSNGVVVNRYCGARDPGNGFVGSGFGCFQRNTGQACSAAEDSAPVFDAHEYGVLNRDVAAAGVDRREHWRSSGKAEGRLASSGFNVREYVVANPDVARAFGPTNWAAAIAHYASHGRFERRATRTTQTSEPGWTATIYDAPTIPVQPSDDRYFVQISNAGAAATNNQLDLGLDTSVITGLPNVAGAPLYGPPQNPVDGVTGFTGLQQYGGQFGIAIDSRPVKEAVNARGQSNKAAHPDVAYSLMPLVINRNAKPHAWRPWASGGALRTHLQLRIPFAGGANGGGSQAVTFYFMRDTTTAVGFYVGAVLFDTRPEEVARDVNVNMDACGFGCSGSAIFTVPLRKGSPFLSVATSSSEVATTTFEHSAEFSFAITADNMRNLIARAKQTQPEAKLSEDPGNYQVESWNFNPEVFLPLAPDGTATGDGWIGLSGRVLATGPH